MAPTVTLENLIYDCRLMNVATTRGKANDMRDMLAESDRQFDPQAYVLDPSVVLKISKEIIKGQSHLERTKIAASATISELRDANKSGALKLNDREVRYLDIFEEQLNSVPNDKTEFLQAMIKQTTTDKFDPAKYDL
jgi:methanol--5-hydroxybenzimidazolylcobamide Co-methyltransferase